MKFSQSLLGRLGLLLGCLRRRQKLERLLNRVERLAGHFHVGNQLDWHLLEDLLGQVSTGHGIVEHHELHDVTSARLATLVRQAATVAIELLHHGEVSSADAHNDDRAGKLGQLVDQVASLPHVVDGAVRQDQQGLVLAELGH